MSPEHSQRWSRGFTHLLPQPKLPIPPSNIFATINLGIRERFGVFPHRNNVLGNITLGITEQFPTFPIYENKALTSINLGITEQFRALLPDVSHLRLPDYRKLVLPENLWDVTALFDSFKPLLVDEGIPLMWIPRASTVDALLEAPDAATRRRLLGRRWQGIATDCEEVLDTIETPDLLEYRSFTASAVSAMRAGHVSAAQALATNTLDSVLYQHLQQQARVTVTSHYETPKFPMEGKATHAMTFAPVWRAYVRYKPKYDAPPSAVPRVFARHASAHGVSRRQYTRPNATISLMLATSVLKYFDRELHR